jgi:lysophospholipase L1-like esterase
MEAGTRPVHERLEGDDPTKWLFYGDSITHGALHTFGHRDYSELFAERVRYELGRSSDIVINTAIDGDTTEELLAGFDWRVAQFEPDVVFLMIGMNDCHSDTLDVADFTANLHSLIDSNVRHDAVTVLQTTCPILDGETPDRDERFDEFMQAIRNVATDRQLPLIDHTAHWREHFDDHDYLMSNRIHPNEYGHRAFAELVFRELGIWDATSTTCRLLVPGTRDG